MFISLIYFSQLNLNESLRILQAMREWIFRFTPAEAEKGMMNHMVEMCASFYLFAVVGPVAECVWVLLTTNRL